MMLLGLVLLALAFAGPRDTIKEVAATATTEPSVLAENLAPGTTAPMTPAGLGRGVAPLRMGRRPLRGFGEVQATITSSDGEVCEVCLLAASTVPQRERGLMEVTDDQLGGYDGMLFEYPGEVAGAFWMRNTPLPLSIVYFDAAGEVVSTNDMAPCEDRSDCPSYPADRPFQFAIEVPEGMLADIGVDDGAVLRVSARTCTLAAGGG